MPSGGSLSVFSVQQVGRALLCALGNAGAGILLDYAGMVRMHGPVDAVTAQTAAKCTASCSAAGGLRAKPCPG